MYASITLLAALASTVLAAAHPEVTPAPRSLAARHDQLKIYELQRRAADLYGRQEAGDLSFCFGRNSICVQSNRLNSDCDQYYGDTDLTQYYRCLCTNGYVSTRQACGWCNDAWSIDQIAGIDEINSGQCTSYSFSIAPIPQSVLALQSSYNATWTGTLLGATATIGPGPAKDSSSSSSAAGVRSTSSRSLGGAITTSSRSSSTSEAGGVGNVIGGGGNQKPTTDGSVTVVTLGGDAVTQTTPAVTQTITKGASSSSSTSQGSSGNRVSNPLSAVKGGAGAIFSIFIFSAMGMLL